MLKPWQAGRRQKEQRVNNYCFDDLYIGMTEGFEVTITSEMMESFRNITGDINPLHTDAGFAGENGYDDKVVYGMLTSSFLSTLAGVYLPGKRSLIREVEVKLKKPVYVGDKLRIEGKVAEINSEFGIFTMKVSMTNEAGDKVLRGKMQMGVLQ